ncbi:MAG: hypothetical protein CM1200mP28_09480 [Deltaproteobacteria bacterium]|nr:MAG: hypothetical protein CM1200mP28_09480 [Deltaproteobacteria bacterium]
MTVSSTRWQILLENHETTSAWRCGYRISMVVMANKEYVIEKQGNFGNLLTGDPASASKIFEARLTPLAKETLFNTELTEYAESYDGRNKEPVVLPCKLPLSLLFGAEGIAVGMSTRILPHNSMKL